jgi:hypothetical protein
VCTNLDQPAQAEQSEDRISMRSTNCKAVLGSKAAPGQRRLYLGQNPSAATHRTAAAVVHQQHAWASVVKQDCKLYLPG